MSKQTKLIFIFIFLLVVYLLFQFFSSDDAESNTKPQHSGFSSSVPASNSIEKPQIKNFPHESKLALPASDLPLKDSFATLKKLADENNQMAILRLFKETQLCTQFQQRRQLVENLELNEKIKENSANDSRLNNFLEKEKTFIQQNEHLCQGLEQNQLDEVIPASLKAAQSGNLVAANCYISMNMTMNSSALINHPEWLTEFKQNALSIAKASVEKGDIAMVGKLQSAYSGIYPSLLSGVTGIDQAESYRYLNLLYLASPENQNVGRRLKKIADQLPINIQQDAQSWAEQTYKNNFSKGQLEPQKTECLPENL